MNTYLRIQNEKSSDSSEPSNSTDLIYKELETSEEYTTDNCFLELYQQDIENLNKSSSSESKSSSSESKSDIFIPVMSSSNKIIGYEKYHEIPFIFVCKLYISIFLNLFKVFVHLRDITQLFLKFSSGKSFFPLYYYSTEIAFDRHRQFRKMICMIIFFVLNLAVIIFDISQLAKNYSGYMLASIIIRFLLVPLFSYYNIITVFIHKAKDKTLRIVNYVSIIFTVFTIIAIIACSIFIKIYQSEYRFKNLEYFPPNDNITIINEKKITLPICTFQVFNISAFDAFGYALGGYDIKQNKTIFENQMKIFFGENYSSHISYNVHELDKYFLFLKYFDSLTNTHVFAFRGFNSGPEIAFQLELFAAEYVIPFFEDNVPFLSFINENWLSFYTDFLNAFGLRFFENRNLIVKYVNSIKEIYDQVNISENENVLFTGINCGGVIAKISGTLLNQRSISFVSFPIELDFLQNWFQYSLSDASLVTNIFNVDSFFSLPDTQYANNIGIDTPAFQKSKSCTSDFCEMFSKLDNVYKTFCSMSEICGKGNQFNYYCQKTIGEKFIRIIRENLKDDED